MPADSPERPAALPARPLPRAAEYGDVARTITLALTVLADCGSGGCPSRAAGEAAAHLVAGRFLLDRIEEREAAQAKGLRGLWLRWLAPRRRRRRALSEAVGQARRMQRGEPISLPPSLLARPLRGLLAATSL